MPVIGTPAAADQIPCCEAQAALPAPAAVPCSDQTSVGPNLSTVHQQPIPQRLRTVYATGGQAVTVGWTMLDREGRPVDLTACGCGDSNSSSASAGICPDYRLQFRENIGELRIREAYGELVEAETGKLRFELSAELLALPGVYFAEAQVLDHTSETPQVLFSNMFYLVVNRSISASDETAAMRGPPSIAEIRLHLRDSSPQENFVLDNIKFDDAEIAMAITRPIEYWNEVPPPLRRYTTQNFPHRFHWLEAIVGQLYMLVAEHQRANNLQYQAGGIAVDDMNREMNYERAAQTRWQAWKDFVRARKASDNLARAYGGISSPYGRLG